MRLRRRLHARACEAGACGLRWRARLAARAGAHTRAPRQVRGTVVELGPGDTLLVPAYWFAHTQLLGGDGGGAALGNPYVPAAAQAGARGGSAALLLRLAAPPPPAGEGGGGGEGRARLMPDGALQLQMARMVELVVAAEVGAANVRRWLLVRRAGGPPPLQVACGAEGCALPRARAARAPLLMGALARARAAAVRGPRVGAP